MVDEQKMDFEVTKARWLQLVVFCLAQLINQVAWISLQPIADRVSTYYD